MLQRVKELIDKHGLIGDQTGGYLSMNNFYDIDEKHILNLTIGIFSDINDKLYDSEKISPEFNINS